MRVRIGFSDAAREIDVDVDDADEFARRLEEAMGGSGGLVWVTDSQGHRYGIAAAKVAYIDIEGGRTRSVGFGQS